MTLRYMCQVGGVVSLKYATPLVSDLLFPQKINLFGLPHTSAMLFHLAKSRSFLRAKSQRLATLAIRREDKNRWERRVPLTPQHVNQLITQTNAKIYIQPSNNRIFNDATYRKVMCLHNARLVL